MTQVQRTSIAKRCVWASYVRKNVGRPADRFELKKKTPIVIRFREIIIESLASRFSRSAAICPLSFVPRTHRTVHGRVRPTA